MLKLTIYNGNVNQLGGELIIIFTPFFSVHNRETINPSEK